MGNERPVPGEFQELFQSLLLRRGVGDHIVPDTGQFHDFGRDGLFRIHKSVKPLRNFTVFEKHRTDFRQAFALGAESGGFGVKNDKFPVKRRIVPSCDRFHAVVDKISLHTVNYFEIRAAFPNVLYSVHGVREGLHHPVVCNGNGFMAPFIGGFYNVRCL